MKKFIPGEKLSKKATRELNRNMRKTWGALNPVTRAPADPKVYNRKKLRKDDYDSSPELFLLFSLSIPIPLYKLQDQHELSNNERIPCRIMSSRCRECPSEACRSILHVPSLFANNRGGRRNAEGSVPYR